MNLPELQTCQGAGSPKAGPMVGARCQAELTRVLASVGYRCGSQRAARPTGVLGLLWGAHSPCAHSSRQHTSPAQAVPALQCLQILYSHRINFTPVFPAIGTLQQL